jgi:lysyl-tRNA synthetase class 2
VDELLQLILKTTPADKKTYRDIFIDYLQLDPHQASIDDLSNVAAKHFSIKEKITDHDTWLQLLMSHCIEPQLGKEQPCFIYDFPASQAALAKIQKTKPPVASRFEVYFKGIELANGFHELQDANEQRSRFEKNRAERKQLSFADVPIDEFFLTALESGLPDCAGVALGIDR